VSEYLVERMVLAGARRICFVIASQKSDIVEYYGAWAGGADAFYVVQPEPDGLCDALFRALPFVGDDEEVVVGLPDTVWFPEDGLMLLEPDPLTFLLFPVEQPELFDAVITDEGGWIEEIQVKQPEPRSSFVWGAFKTRGRTLRALHALYCERARSDIYLGTLVNAYLARGNRARAVHGGHAYVDVGTLNGYREAMQLLARQQRTANGSFAQPLVAP
jgi:glucose-1-phosphate thymidylyltransferase